MKTTPDQLQKVFSKVDPHDPIALLEFAVEQFKGRIALACSFSMEDAALIDIIASHSLPIEVFALDTGRLNEETYLCAEQIRLKYKLSINWFFPEAKAVEKLEQKKGLFSFKENIENRKECCSIRKVEPLGRALAGLDAWITGQRREQSITRAELDVVEYDRTNALPKLNPLATWSLKQVEHYIKEHKVPCNSLYLQGYTSIGCAPCTRAIHEGEDERAGRWWWENPEHKECGLHLHVVNEK